MEASQIAEILKTKLGAVFVEVEDESAVHSGHEGARSGGGHYRITVVSDLFAGKPAIERHRLVYSALENELGRDIHALAIKALAPAMDGQVPNVTGMSNVRPPAETDSE